VTSEKSAAKKICGLVVKDAHPIVDCVGQNHKPNMEAEVCLPQQVRLLVVVLRLVCFP
jgi:hypothetical protein